MAGKETASVCHINQERLNTFVLCPNSSYNKSYMHELKVVLFKGTFRIFILFYGLFVSVCMNQCIEV